ncbi:ATP-dependent DNA helicase RecG [Methyloterricola oryzae]|uniref:ATP-dependent DNA helicase RecG n=1 Tax=Methyloterricola oryzae TaxID=1495050 RepID=UPI0005EB0FFB|nr:ATP-dependent DNA helicase RecG [Methyloterricola oryzae]
MVSAPALDGQPLACLRGAGGKTQERLARLGIYSVHDLLFHLPLRYEDRTSLTPIGALRHGVQAQIEGMVELTDLAAKGRRALVCRISDGSGGINLRFFHFSAEQRTRLKVGTRLRCFGEAREGYYGLEMVHPEYQVLDSPEAAPLSASLTPVYPLTEGLHQKTLRGLIGQALNLLHLAPGTLPEMLPEAVRQRHRFPVLAEALRMLHLPEPGASPQTLRIAQQRLAFEELLAHHLSLSRFRTQVRCHSAPRLTLSKAATHHFEQALPFGLTGAQRRVIAEIAADLQGPQPMMRLVQGDVGSGKTVVAARAALTALSANFQVAVMAPTELLAEQHVRSFRQWLEPLGAQVVFLAGRLKGAARRETLRVIAEGEAGVVLGTHALFQDEVRFQRLGLVIIDEQHRFGVHQRLALREKGRHDGLTPHQLIMTATPIPRTLAMLGYADLDISVIDELPPGRTPVKTAVIPATRRPEVIARIVDWVAQGRQAYWVCTLIEESETLQCEAAEKTAALLREALPEVRVGLIHGRMKSAEKDVVMAAFKAAEVDLLVATTVIEVGVDVPNAGLMVIENPERLGLAQLHQLRGRVGRGPGESHCLLMYQPPLTDTAKQRLGILRETADGFLIAERDLQLRGPGELLGVRQTGQVQFKVADLARDEALLDAVKAAADALLRNHPERVGPLLRRWLGDAGRYAEV